MSDYELSAICRTCGRILDAIDANTPAARHCLNDALKRAGHAISRKHGVICAWCLPAAARAGGGK